jgi:hypothetical protein
MSTEENKALYRRYFEEMNKQHITEDRDLIDAGKERDTGVFASRRLRSYSMPR